MKITGQRTRANLDRYNITAEVDLKNAASAVTDLHTGPTRGQVVLKF